VTPKHESIFNELHGVIPKKINVFTVTPLVTCLRSREQQWPGHEIRRYLVYPVHSWAEAKRCALISRLRLTIICRNAAIGVLYNLDVMSTVLKLC
jgi:hypothetical protein